MTIEELAARLNGREYCSEITDEEEAEAKAAGLVAIFGASDDLVELRGAIDDEGGCYGGGTILISPRGLVPNRDDDWTDEQMEAYLRDKKAAVKVEALWCAPDEPGWTYKTSAPHATFEILEDGEVYCRGIVLALPDLPEEAEG